MLGWIALLLAILLGIYIVAGGGAMEGLEGGEIVYLVLGGALVALYIGSLAFDYRGRALTGLRHAIVWVGLFMALVTGYAYRDAFQDAAARVTGELAPPGTAFDIETSEGGEKSVRLRRASSGHYAARAEIDGARITLMVDTGASTVVLKTADAERAGIDTTKLNFTVAVDTANGTTYAAPVRLRSIAIGPIEVRDVEALVSKPGNLKESLLGMSFLRRLRSYEFSGEYLTLRS